MARMFDGARRSSSAGLVGARRWLLRGYGRGRWRAAGAGGVLIACIALLSFTSVAVGSKRGCTGLTVKTLSANSVTPLSAVLRGSVSTCGTHGVKASFVLGTAATGSFSVPADRRSHTFAYTVRGLTPNERITYLLRAKKGGRVVRGGRVTLTTPAIQIATLAATAVTSTSAVLNGTADALGASGLSAGFSWSGPGTPGGTTSLTGLPSDRVSHPITATLTGLTPGTKYTFDAMVTGASGPLARCGCSVSFTTLARPAPPAPPAPVLVSLDVTAPASVTAGQPFLVSATGVGTGGANLGDLSPLATFTLTPEGSCTGTSCTATIAGPHTVHAVVGAASGTAATTLTAGPLDHLVVSPPTATTCATQWLHAANANVFCNGAGFSQQFFAEGYDHYGNDIGDVSSNTTFTAGQFSCPIGVCSLQTTGQQTVDATDGSATGAGTLTVVDPGFSCQGENYDVDGNPLTGCEVAQPSPGHTTIATALDNGHVSDCDGGNNMEFTFSGNMLADTRVHENPAVTAFDPVTGSAPFWFSIVGDGHTFCQNDLVVNMTTSGEPTAQDASCYRLFVNTGKNQYSAQTDSTGSLPPNAINYDSGGQFVDGATILFEVTRTCTPTDANVTWTISGHL